MDLRAKSVCGSFIVQGVANMDVAGNVLHILSSDLLRSLQMRSIFIGLPQAVTMSWVPSKF